MTVEVVVVVLVAVEVVVVVDVVAVEVVVVAGVAGVVVVGPVGVVVGGPGIVGSESVVTITPLLSSLTTLVTLFHQVQPLLKAGHQKSSRTPQATGSPPTP